MPAVYEPCKLFPLNLCLKIFDIQAHSVFKRITILLSLNLITYLSSAPYQSECEVTRVSDLFPPLIM